MTNHVNNYAYSGKLLWLTTLITMPTPVSYYDIQPRNNYAYSDKLLWLTTLITMPTPVSYYD